MDLGSWLRSIGLEAYEAIFRENAIDVDLLHELTEDHLREMGLPLGVRLKLRKAINALGPFGEPISPAAALSTPVGETAERRHVTVLFSDLVGSTALSARMDAEDFREVIQEDRRMCFRIGVHVGDVMVRGADDGINIAARLQALAEPGGAAINHSAE
jgi:hypothetical protein